MSATRSKFKIDPADGGTYTFADLSDYYSGKYPWQAIQDYWDYQCIPVFPNKAWGKGSRSGKGKAKETSRGKMQSKTNAETEKVKTKTKAKWKAKAEGEPALNLSFVNLEGEKLASWSGSSKANVGEVRKSVAEQIGKHMIRIEMVWQDQKLVDDESLHYKGMGDQAEVLVVIDDAMAEQKWEEFKTKLEDLDYGDDTKDIYELAVECLQIGTHPVGEVSNAVREACEEAGSMTEMPVDWYEKLAEHPESKCDTPAQWNNELLHCAIFHGFSLADKPFFKNGPWTDKVDYPEWGWSSRIAGTPLDMAARKLEISLENPPDWGLRSQLPAPEETLDRLQGNFMLLLQSGFKMSRVEGGGRKLAHGSEGVYDKELSWKPALIDRNEPPYDRYGAIHQAWVEAGKPLVTIPAESPETIASGSD